MFICHRTMKKILIIILPLLIFGISMDISFAHDAEDESMAVIHMSESGFEPEEANVVLGGKVIFENVGNEDHWPASNIHPTHRAYPRSDIKDCNTSQERFMFDACRNIKPGQTYTFQFDEVGEWRFHDHSSPNFSGKIIVTEGDGVESQVDIDVSKDNKNGFFKRMWTTIKNLLATVKGLLTKSEVDELEGLGELEEYKEKELVYNPMVKKDSTLLATDDDELFSYVKSFGPTAALEQLFSLESQFGNCHDKAHVVGRAAYELYDSDAFRQCAMLCQSGCYHGAVEAYFREHGTVNLEDNINDLCAGNINSFIEHQCRHGVGHGLMAWSDYKIFDALVSCDLLDDGLAQSSCYSGVFMENIVQSMAAFLEIEGHTTEYLSDDPHYPCNIVEEKYEPTCYFLQTDRMIVLAGGDFSIVAANCTEVENQFSRRMCFDSMGRTVGGRNRNNPQGAIASCNYIENDLDKLACLSGAVQDTFWDPSGQDNALTFCKLLEKKEEKSSCYSTILERVPQVLIETRERQSFCDKVESEYREQCSQYIK
jgi:plastocyanin